MKLESNQKIWTDISLKRICGWQTYGKKSLLLAFRIMEIKNIICYHYTNIRMAKNSDKAKKLVRIYQNWMIHTLLNWMWNCTLS